MQTCAILTVNGMIVPNDQIYLCLFIHTCLQNRIKSSPNPYLQWIWNITRTVLSKAHHSCIGTSPGALAILGAGCWRKAVTWIFGAGDSLLFKQIPKVYINLNFQTVGILAKVFPSLGLGFQRLSKVTVTSIPLKKNAVEFLWNTSNPRSIFLAHHLVVIVIRVILYHILYTRICLLRRSFC